MFDFVNFFHIELSGLWIFSLIYLIFAYDLWFLFPKFVQIRFSRIPHIKFFSFAYQLIYFLFLFFSLFVSFEMNLWFYVGLFFYLSGLFLYLSGIYYFAINELDKPVTGGVYRIFKHPVYLGFALLIFGIAIAGTSVLLFILAFIHSILAFIIAKKEEIQCLNFYGQTYRSYLNTFKF